MDMPVKPASPGTTAFFVQAAISFGVALVAVCVAIVYLPVNGWVRAFFALGLLYTVTSAFTLAKCVRDRQEDRNLVSRVDQARLEKFLAEHDPFKVETT
ncbi:YiaA/YiaB family inner membrane protein [Amycolatopsis arida]|nr:YiaA/YiaB family inner membrane protein [Amycolatopsis arida]